MQTLKILRYSPIFALSLMLVLLTKCSGQSGTMQLASGDIPCTPYFWNLDVSTNCSTISQLRLGGTEVPLSSVCTAPGCAGAWSYLPNLTYILPGEPLYCCACNDPTCDGLGYFDDVNCPGGYMATKTYGLSFYCNVSWDVCGGEMDEDSDGSWVCVDNTCTGSMVRKCPWGMSCLTNPPVNWVCVDESCPESSDSFGMMPSANNTDWICEDNCPSGKWKQYNMTSRQWECPSSGLSNESNGCEVLSISAVFLVIIAYLHIA